MGLRRFIPGQAAGGTSEPASGRLWYGVLIYAVIIGFIGLGVFEWVYGRSMSDAGQHSRLITYAAGFVGGALYSLVGCILRATGVLRDVSRRYVLTMYIVGPWIALILTLPFYFLLRGGVVTLAGVSELQHTGQELDEATKTAWAIVGFTVGIGWQAALGYLVRRADQQWDQPNNITEIPSPNE